MTTDRKEAPRREPALAYRRIVDEDSCVIDNDELLVAILGERKVATFKEVKLTSMRLARVVREMIADDLDGSLPTSGSAAVVSSDSARRSPNETSMCCAASATTAS